MYIYVVSACYCAPTPPTPPYQRQFSDVREMNSSSLTDMPLFVKLNVGSTRTGSFHYFAR